MRFLNGENVENTESDRDLKKLFIEQGLNVFYRPHLSSEVLTELLAKHKNELSEAASPKVKFEEQKDGAAG